MAADTKRGAVWAAVNTKHNGVMLSVDDLREQLATQGLHIVTAADKAVLDAADAWLDEGTCAIRALADAVRARRGSAK